MLRVVAEPSRQTTYAPDVALVAAGRKRGIEPCRSAEAPPFAMLVAADQVCPASSEKVDRMRTVTLAKSVQLTIRLPVRVLTSMNSLSGASLLMKAVLISKGPFHCVP